MQVRALTEPARLTILRELREPASAAGLARRLSMPRQRVNYHLRELEDAGLVRLVEERRRGNCTERIVRATAATYVIDPGMLGDLAADPERVPDRASSAFLVALAARAIREVAALRENADAEAGAGGQPWATPSLHADVRFASPADVDAFAEDLAHEVARLVREYHDGSAARGRAYRVFLGGYPAPPQSAVSAAHSAIAAPAGTPAQEPPG